MGSKVRTADEYDNHLKKIEELGNRMCTKLNISIGRLIFVASIFVSLIVGQIASMVSPEIDNYIKRKDNIFNVIFVKRGWGWTTAAVITFYLLLLYNKNGSRWHSNQEKIIAVRKALFRYAFLTTWWVLFTQWCFGVPIMDKIFLWTGGLCKDVSYDKLFSYKPFLRNSEPYLSAQGSVGETNEVSSYMCRKLKGQWHGGHDPSGHVFLLAQSSLYLFFECSVFWRSWLVFFRHTKSFFDRIRTTGLDLNLFSLTFDYFHNNPESVLVVFISLWLSMLFMTNIYFHFLFEKIAGLLFSLPLVLFLYY